MKWLVLVNHKIYKWTSLALKEQRKHHKKLLGSLFNHLFHYANKNVLVKPLSLFCITSVFFTIQSKAGTIDSYWMRLNMISWRKLRSDLSAEGKGWGTRFIILDIMQKPHSTIVLLHIFEHCAKRTPLSEFVKLWEHYKDKEPGNLADFELDMINAISAADWIRFLS